MAGRGQPGVAPQTAKREQYAALIERGVSFSEACRIVGINRRTGKRWRHGRTITGRRAPSGNHAFDTTYENSLRILSGACRIEAGTREPVFTDGPYVESKEHIAGFWIIEAPHLDVALRLAALGSKNCNRRILATVAAQEGGHRGAQNELTGRYDTGSGRGSHISPCVTSGDERQPTRSGRSAHRNSGKNVRIAASPDVPVLVNRGRRGRSSSLHPGPMTGMSSCCWSCRG
jgi:hypothetical protein